MPDKIRPTRRPSRPGPQSSGPAVDKDGGPVIDPTENVIALTDAANKRQDDLRDLNDRRLESNIGHMRELMALRAEHQAQMQAAEASRVNSIRQVDQANVQTAADRQLAAIQTLAATTTANAENLRSALTSTATAIAVQTANTVSQINERIASLEKAAYKGEGKQAVADPMIAQLVAEMRSLASSRASDAGRQTVTDPLLVQLAHEVRDLVTQRAADAGKQAIADPGLVSLVAEVHRNSATLAAAAGKTDQTKMLFAVAAFVATALSIYGFVRSPATPDPQIAAILQELRAQRTGTAAAPPQVLYAPAPPGTMLPTTPPQPAPR